MNITDALVDYLLKLADSFGYAITTVGGIMLVILIAWGVYHWIADSTKGREL